MSNNSKIDEKRLEWLFRERKYRSWPLKVSFINYFFIIFLYLFRDTFGFWWGIYLILYILGVAITPSERDVQKAINKELGLDG